MWTKVRRAGEAMCTVIRTNELSRVVYRDEEPSRVH